MYRTYITTGMSDKARDEDSVDDLISFLDEEALRGLGSSGLTPFNAVETGVIVGNYDHGNLGDN